MDETKENGENMFFKVKLAELVIGVKCLYGETKDFCREYLTDEESQDFNVAINRKDIEAECKLATSNLDKERDVESYSCEYLERLALMRKIADHLPEHNCFLMHGAVISVQGDGYLFTAPSGTGKSTHVSLWKKYIDGVEIINGDKPFLRVTDHGIWAYGTPWAGKEGWQKNERVLLKGICLLMRGKENRVSMLVQEQVLPFLIRQIYYTDNPEMAGKTLELLDQVMKQIYFYEVSCNVSKEAALCCYDGLRGV